MNPNPPRGAQAGVGEGQKGGKKLFLAPRREARWPPRARRPRARGALCGGRRPLPGSPCPRARSFAPGGPAARAPNRGRGAGREAARGEDADAEPDGCLRAQPVHEPRAGPLGGAGALCWLPAAAAAAARGGRARLWRGADLTLCWPSRGWEGGEQRWPRAPTDTSGARATRLPGPPPRRRASRSPPPTVYLLVPS